MRSRRNLGVDVELAEGLKEIARSRGMSMASYLRKLFEEVIEVERLGHYAPGVLAEKRVELLLSRLDFIYIPIDLLEKHADPSAALKVGEKVGNTLKELDVGVENFIERVALNAGIAVTRDDSIVLLPTTDAREVLKNLILGMARGYGLKILTSGNLTIIKTK
ncbi:MAG: CopG family transcriptional regulator [Zestosphaera sp.]